MRPDTAPDRPDVAWSDDPAATPERLYQDYPDEVAGAVVNRLVEAKSLELEMTSDVLAVLPTHARMHGLKFRIKSPDSLARKLNLKYEVDPFSEPAEIIDRITDVIRYTAVAAPEQVVPTAQTVVSQLVDRGWTVVEVEQSYADGNSYKGLHVIVRHPGGMSAELQFHSEASQQVKDHTHLDYETVRNTSVPAEERVAKSQQMVRAWAEVPTPAGIEELTELVGCQAKTKSYPPIRN